MRKDSYDLVFVVFLFIFILVFLWSRPMGMAGGLMVSPMYVTVWFWMVAGVIWSFIVFVLPIFALLLVLLSALTKSDYPPKWLFFLTLVSGLGLVSSGWLLYGIFTLALSLVAIVVLGKNVRGEHGTGEEDEKNETGGKGSSKGTGLG